MLETIMKHGIIFYVMGILMAAGVLAKIISYITSRKLVKSASDIQKSNQRLMRLVKAKFEHASMVSDKVQNVEAFVRKYLYEYKVFGVRLGTFSSLPVKMSCLILAFGFFGVIASYQTEGPAEQTFRYGAFAAIYAVVLISIHILSDEKAKLDAVRNYMVEYLENVCVHRYEKASQVLQAAKEEAENEAENEAEDEVEKVLEKAEEENEAEIQAAKQEQDLRQQDDQEIRIRAILEEFLA